MNPQQVVQYLYCKHAGKRSYFTPKQAKRARINTTTSNGEDPEAMNVYECDHCKRFHIGHPKKVVADDIIQEIKYLHHDQQTITKLQQNITKRMHTIANTLYNNGIKINEIAQILGTKTRHIASLIKQHHHQGG